MAAVLVTAAVIPFPLYLLLFLNYSLVLKEQLKSAHKNPVFLVTVSFAYFLIRTGIMVENFHAS